MCVSQNLPCVANFLHLFFLSVTPWHRSSWGALSKHAEHNCDILLVADDLFAPQHIHLGEM